MNDSGDTACEYSWEYDDADRVTSFTSPDSGTATAYDYDNGGQLTDADYDYQSDESYAYDLNGNRTGTPYQTGALNRITCDAAGDTYEYDHEGNRIRKTASNNLSKVEYAWDYRNRLATVTKYSRTSVNNSWTQGQTISYAYDAFDRKVGKTVDNPPLGSVPTAARFTFTTGRTRSWSSRRNRAGAWTSRRSSMSCSSGQRSIRFWPTISGHPFITVVAGAVAAEAVAM